MANGLLGGGFMGGWLGADEQRRQQEAHQLQKLGGLLALQNAMEQQQMTPLKMKQLEIAVANAEMNNKIRQQLMGGGAPSGPAPMAFGAGGMSLPGGGQANVNTGQVVPPQAPGVSGGPGMAQAMQMILTGDPGLTAYGKAIIEQNKPIAAREGAPIVNPATGQIMFYAPKLEAGMSPQFSGGQVTGVQNIPGYVDAMTARTSAQEEAKAGFDLVQVPDGKGGTVMMPRSQAITRLGAPRPGQTPTGWQIPPAEQAQRDADARRIVAAEQTGGAGMVPTRQVVAPGPQTFVPPGTQMGQIHGPLGSTPSEADRAASRKREELKVSREADLPQAQLQVKTQLDDIDRLINLTNETMKSPALSRSVGLVGAFPSVPGNPAANVDSLVDSLKAQISGMKLQAMRNASKTGGAVGQVTEREWPRLENMIVALNKKMSPEVFRSKLSELVEEMNKSKEALQSAFEQEYGSVMPQQRRRTDAANDPLGIRR